MENFIEFLIEEALIFVPVLWIIGRFLKKTPDVPDWTIPWALVVVGIAVALATLEASVEAAMQGILAAGVAVLGHQLVKQTRERT